MMTSRERVLAAARRQQPDRTPRGMHFDAALTQALRAHLGVEDLAAHFGNDTRPVWHDPTALTTDFSRYYDRPVEWDEWGRGRVWDAEHRYAEYLYPLERAESVAEIEAYPWPDLDQPYRYAKVAERTAAIQAQGFAAVAGLAETVFEIAWQLRSMDRLFEDMLTDDPMATVLLDRITDQRVYAARQYARAGADILHLGDDVAMQQGLMMSRDLWRRWFAPRLGRVIAAAREERPDILIEYHSDGRINDLIPDLIDLGVDILNPVQPECVDHAWVKATYGDRLSFSGGLGVQSVLPFGTPEEVREHVITVVRTLGAGGGLIVAPSHVVEFDVPVANVLAMVGAMDEAAES